MNKESEARRRKSGLIDALEAALQRETFWLARGDLPAVMEALPGKEELIAALLACDRTKPARASTDKLDRRAQELTRLQDENCRIIEKQRKELGILLQSVVEATQRLRRMRKVSNPYSARTTARWA